MMAHFLYGQKEIDYLKKKDKKLAAAIDRIGLIEREVIPDLFEALVNSIVSQQISAKAVSTIWSRMKSNLGNITPENISRKAAEEIQQCGITMKKAMYIKEIAGVICCGEFKIEEIYSLSDADVCKRLTALNGIGAWTAEMLMIFSLQRPDVVSWGDLAIRRGMMMLYHHRKLDKSKFERYKRRYSPYGSVASLYLWAISSGR